jgi:hypothetical protein
VRYPQPDTVNKRIAAGTITVTDPQSSTVLLTLPIVLPAASEPFDIVQILLAQTATLWRDFVVTGLSTATKAALQIWYLVLRLRVLQVWRLPYEGCGSCRTRLEAAVFRMCSILGVEAAVPDGFVEISAGLAVQSGQPAVRCNQSGEHAEASFECEDGTLAMT